MSERDLRHREKDLGYSEIKRGLSRMLSTSLFSFFLFFSRNEMSTFFVIISQKFYHETT